jgi:hypothetical protein
MAAFVSAMSEITRYVPALRFVNVFSGGCITLVTINIFLLQHAATTVRLSDSGRSFAYCCLRVLLLRFTSETTVFLSEASLYA